MRSSMSNTSTGNKLAASLTYGQRWTRIFLVLLGVATMGLAISAEPVPPGVRVFAAGLAFLFLHAAANRPALAEPGLSFRKSAMSRLPRALLAIAETTMTLGLGYYFVGKLFDWLA
jgi:hypothetical protein